MLARSIWSLHLQRGLLPIAHKNKLMLVKFEHWKFIFLNTRHYKPIEIRLSYKVIEVIKFWNIES